MSNHRPPEFEQKDILGKTRQFAGTVGTSNLTLPAAPLGVISEFLIRNPDTNNITTKLLLSLDGGITFFTLGRGEFLIWSPKNNESDMPIQQIVIKGSSPTTFYELLANFEPT
jgi:hypothetical protein